MLSVWTERKIKEDYNFHLLDFARCAGAVAQSVERATPGEEVPGSIPAGGHPLPTGCVGFSMMWPAETEVMVSQLCLMCGNT